MRYGFKNKLVSNVGYKKGVKMKIAVLMGSPRKKDSYNICKEIEATILDKDEKVDFDYIFLGDYNIKDCVGCCLCFQSGEEKCPCKSDHLEGLKARLISADGLIIATPVYAYQVTAQLKRFIDRLSYWFHRQELVGKPTLIVITTDGGGNKQVYKYLKMTASGWGLDLLGNLQICSPMYFKDRVQASVLGYDESYFRKKNKALKSVSVKFIKTLKDSKLKTPSVYDIFMFNCLRSKTYTSALDYKFWAEKGWLNADYFYEVKLNPFKRWGGHLVKAIIHKMGQAYIK